MNRQEETPRKPLEKTYKSEFSFSLVKDAFEKLSNEKLLSIVEANKEKFVNGFLNLVAFGEKYYKVGPDLKIEHISYDEFWFETAEKPRYLVIPEDYAAKIE